MLQRRLEEFKCDRVTQAAFVEKLLVRMEQLKDEKQRLQGILQKRESALKETNTRLHEVQSKTEAERKVSLYYFDFTPSSRNYRTEPDLIVWYEIFSL